MIDRPFYYNKPLELEVRGLTRDKVITCLTEQKDKQLGLFMAIQAAAFIAISCVAFALIAYFSQAAFKAVLLTVAGCVIGGGSAYLFYSHFFLLTKVMSDLRAKYKGEGEIAFSEIGKILAVSDESTQEKLVKQMSFEQAVMARPFINPENFKKWVKGSDFSVVLNFDDKMLKDLKPVIDKNFWVLRALEKSISSEQYHELAARNLIGEPSKVFGLVNDINGMSREEAEEAGFPMSDLVKEILSGKLVELNHENLHFLLEQAEWLQSGELYRYLDEHIYSHIDRFDQNDLVEMVENYPSLIQTRSYLARQIISRNITLDNWRELWTLASRVAKEELGDLFIEFVKHNIYSDLVDTFEMSKSMLSKKAMKLWLDQNYLSDYDLLRLFCAELSNPSGNLKLIYDTIHEKNRYFNWTSIKISQDNVFQLIKLPTFEKEAKKYILDNWKTLLLNNKIGFESLLEMASIKGEVLVFLKEHHLELIEKKILTELAWKDYQRIYFS